MERALELNPNLAQAHAQMGRIKEQVDFDWVGADASCQRAVALDPGNPEVVRTAALQAAFLGRFDEALQMNRRAVDLDPLNADSWELLTETKSGKHSLDMIPPVVVYFMEEIVMTELFSVNEAAAIAEVSPETIRTALEKKSVKPSHKRKTGKAVRHQFSVGDVLLVKLLVEFPFPLSRQDKESLAQILARGDTKASHWSKEGADIVYRSGKIQLLVECKSFRQTVAKNLAAFRWGRRRIVSSPEVLGGEPVFRGTRIPVQHVASLFRKGAPEQEIVEDFPSLSERDLAYARLFSRFGEKPGRPRKHLAIHRKRRAT